MALDHGGGTSIEYNQATTMDHIIQCGSRGGKIAVNSRVHSRIMKKNRKG